MLKELRSFDNLGTPNFFWELIQLLKAGGSWKVSDLKFHFYNREIDNRQVFDGCVPILETCDVISIEEETEEVILAYAFKNLYSERMCQSRLLEVFLKKLNDDEEFHNIFKRSHFDYLRHKAIVVEGAAFGLKYVNFKRLLIDFDFLRPHPEFQNKFLVSSKWKKFVDLEVTPKVRKSMSLEALKEKIQTRELSGEKAEKFVLEYENWRLDAKDGVQWVAPYDVAAGFDILSFHSKDDLDSNRFIEVKSYVGNTPYFYWTSNEMKVAKEKKDDYLVYLVNRNKMNEEGYEPRMIANPIENILENDSWSKAVDKYYLKEVNG